MPSRLDPLVDMYCRSLQALRRLRLACRPPTLVTIVVFVLALGVASPPGARAEEGMPEGMKGWTYYLSLNNIGHVRTPQEACALSAANHWGVKLDYMTHAATPKQIYDCYYTNPVGGRQFNYSTAILDCEAGYWPAAPGVCMKWREAPRPPACSPGQSGYAVGNPVAVASGAKVQTETDFPGSPNGTLRITRTYRTLRMGADGVSAGQGWSFSFDRSFYTVQGLLGHPGDAPVTVNGAFGDGSYFEFALQDSGAYVSRYDRRESLRSLSGAFDDWALTTRDGSVERFKQVNGQFLLVSSHTKEGAGQFYAYGTDNKLATISDASSRTLAVTWTGDTVTAIAGATGSVRYGYELAKAGDDSEIAQTERLATVDYFAAGSAIPATRRYHYEDPANRYLLTGITDENGARFATYAYNAYGQAVLTEHAGGAQRYTFAYPEKEKRIITDPLGTERELSLAYVTNAGGLVTGASQPGGAGCGPGSSKLTYDEFGRLASSTDFNERKTCFLTDPVRGLLTSEVSGLAPAAACPAGVTEAIAAGSRRTSTQWHPDVAIQTAVASARQITRYVFNGQSDADGAVASCAAGATLPNGKPIVVLCAKTVQATRDANGASGFAAQPDGRPRTWHYSYNAAGQLLTRTGPADAQGQSESVRNVYYEDTTASHAAGDLASTQNAAGDVTRFLEYTRDGLPSRIRRANGVMVTLSYGAMQRVASSTLEDGKGGAETTLYSYDSVGQLTGITSPDGAAVAFTYDDGHRLTGLSDRAGNRLQLTLDKMGNVTRQELRDAAGRLAGEKNRAFDALNRLATIQRAPQSPATQYQYDRGGNLTALTDALGRITATEFDSLDRMTKVALPPAAAGEIAGVIAYDYDQRDGVVSVTDPRKLTTRYTLDGYGQRKAVSSPDTSTSTYQFDDAGNLVSRQDARGVTTGFRHDAAHRITNIGGSAFAYGKDGASAAGRLTAMTDDSGSTSYAYDAFGRLQAQIQTVGTGLAARQFALSYKYGTSGSSTGHITSMTYPSGNRIDIAYGADGQAASLALTAPNASGPTTILSNIRYAPLGAVQGWTWGAGDSAQVYNRDFDADGRITSYPLGGALRTLGYDDADRIKFMRHGSAAGAARLDQSYSYDDLDRLTGAEGATVSQAFAYDANGNRTQARFGEGSYANTISPTSNRLMATTGPAPAKTNRYDDAGNLTSDGTADYAYGADGRLASAIVAGATTRYRYNGFGERVQKSGAAGSETYYVYDAAGRLLGEYDRSGKAEQETVYLNDLPVAILKSAAQGSAAGTDVFAVYADHILTPRVIARLSDKRIVWRWDDADPFGLQPPDDSPDGLPAFTYNPRFPGQVYDKETNSHYNYHRDYDPQTGRFMQSDPVGLAGGINTYAYVGGNPVNAIDPSGLACPAKLREIGACIDSSNFDPRQDCKPNATGDDSADAVARENAYLLDISEKHENGGQISRGNLFKKAKVSGEETEGGYEATLEYDGNAQAIMHSHPKGRRYSAAPGYGDDAVLEHHLPNYVTRKGVTSALELVDGQYQFRTIAGKLTENEKSDTQSQLNEFQSKSRSQDCGCKQ